MAFKTHFDKYSNTDWVDIHYSGHGTVHEFDQNLSGKMCSADEYITVKDFLEIIEKGANRNDIHVIFMLDMCGSEGAFI